VSHSKRYFRTGEGITGAILLALLVLAALIAPLLFPGDPLSIVSTPLVQPFENTDFIFGTDRLGRDVLSGIFYGARTSLLVGLAAALASIILGSIVGTLAGFAGGMVDEALMRITEAFPTVPGFLLALALVSIAGPSLPVLIAAIALSSWTQAARLTRGQVLTIRESDYVASARAIGMHPMEIAFRQILPNALSPIVVAASLMMATAILLESAISFLGLGDRSMITWGFMIGAGRTSLLQSWWLSAIPGAAIFVTVLGLNFLGDALNQALSPRRRLAGGVA